MWKNYSKCYLWHGLVTGLVNCKNQLTLWKSCCLHGCQVIQFCCSFFFQRFFFTAKSFSTNLSKKQKTKSSVWTKFFSVHMFRFFSSSFHQSILNSSKHKRNFWYFYFNSLFQFSVFQWCDFGSLVRWLRHGVDLELLITGCVWLLLVTVTHNKGNNSDYYGFG